MKKLIILFSAIIISSPLFAQVPNGGFETWTTVSGYDVPTGWDQLNAMTSSMSAYTCMKGTPGTVGSSYLKLVSKTMGSMGVMPGISCSGMLDQTVMTNIVPKSGFANTVRPVSLTGSWQYMAYGADQGHISVLLSKWNTAMSKRDTVSYTNYMLPGMVMSWATFTIPLTYISTTLTPDSAIILLSASGSTPVNNSYLYVDNLAFTGSVPTTGVINATDFPYLISVFPNPVSGFATISYNSASDNDIKILVNDMSGRNMLSMIQSTKAGKNKFPVNLSGFAKGIYTITIIDGLNTQIQKIIVE